MGNKIKCSSNKVKTNINEYQFQPATNCPYKTQPSYESVGIYNPIEYQPEYQPRIEFGNGLGIRKEKITVSSIVNNINEYDLDDIKINDNRRNFILNQQTNFQSLQSFNIRLKPKYNNLNYIDFIEYPNLNDLETNTNNYHYQREKNQEDKDLTPHEEYSVYSEDGEIIDFNFLFAKEELRKVKEVDCLICFEKFDPTDNKHAHLDCECIIHGTCFVSHVSNEVSMSNAEIKCPNSYCRKEIHANFIFGALKNSKLLIEKYEKLCLELYLRSTNDVKCCFAPNCTYMFFLEDNETNFYCKACKKT